MRLVRWLAFLIVLAYQQFLLYQERQHMALLIRAIQAEHSDDDDIEPPRPIPECVLPKILPPPKWDVGKLKPQEN